MTNHPALRLISFTGSTQTGRIVASACRAERNLFNRDGWEDAIIVMDDADIDLAVEAPFGAPLVRQASVVLLRRVDRHTKVYKQFVAKLVENTKHCASETAPIRRRTLVQSSTRTLSKR